MPETWIANASIIQTGTIPYVTYRELEWELVFVTTGEGQAFPALSTLKTTADAPGFPDPAELERRISQLPSVRALPFGLLRLAGKVEFQIKANQDPPKRSQSNFTIPTVFLDSMQVSIDHCIRELFQHGELTDFTATGFVTNDSQGQDSDERLEGRTEFGWLDLTSPLGSAILSRAIELSDDHVEIEPNRQKPKNVNELDQDSDFARVTAAFPHLRRSDFLDELLQIEVDACQASQDQAIAGIQKILSREKGCIGSRLLKIGQIVETSCRRYQCLLMLRSQIGGPVDLSTTFTLKVDSSRDGRPVLILASLAESIKKGHELTELPDFVVRSLVELGNEFENAAYARWAGSMRGRQTAPQLNENLTTAQRVKGGKKGGQERAKSLTEEQKKEIGRLGAKKRWEG